MTSSLPLRVLINSFSFYPLQLKKEKGSIYPSQQRAVYPRERSIYLQGKSYSSGQKKKVPTRSYCQHSGVKTQEEDLNTSWKIHSVGELSHPGLQMV